MHLHCVAWAAKKVLQDAAQEQTTCANKVTKHGRLQTNKS